MNSRHILFWAVSKTLGRVFEAFASTLDLERREESSLHAPTRYKETMGPRDWASETNWDFLKSHLCSLYLHPGETASSTIHKSGCIAAAPSFVEHIFLTIQQSVG